MWCWQTSVGPSICYHAAHTTLHFLSDICFEKQIKTIESFDFEISDEQYLKLLKYCLETCGSDYALMGVLVIPLMDLFKLTKNPFDDGPLEQYCAELVYRVLGEIGSQKLEGDADRIKLKEVYDLVKAKSIAGVGL